MVQVYFFFSLPPSLQSLHEQGEANADHTTLLLNCYTKLKAIDELDKFVAVSIVVHVHHLYPLRKKLLPILLVGDSLVLLFITHII